MFIGSRELVAEWDDLNFSSFNWFMRLLFMSLSWSHCSLKDVILSLSAFAHADSSWFCCSSHATTSRALLCSIESLDHFLFRCALKQFHMNSVMKVADSMIGPWAVAVAGTKFAPVGAITKLLEQSGSKGIITELLILGTSSFAVKGLGKAE